MYVTGLKRALHVYIALTLELRLLEYMWMKSQQCRSTRTLKLANLVDFRVSYEVLFFFVHWQPARFEPRSSFTKIDSAAKILGQAAKIFFFDHCRLKHQHAYFKLQKALLGLLALCFEHKIIQTPFHISVSVVLSLAFVCLNIFIVNQLLLKISKFR